MQVILFKTKISRRRLTRCAGRPICTEMRRAKELGPGIGRRLRKAREASGLTVRELAHRAHTTPTTIQDLSDGKGGNSGVGLLSDVAKALAVTPMWLIFGHECRVGDEV